MNPQSPTAAALDPAEPIALAPGVELPADLAARVKAELEPGERVLWAAVADLPTPDVGAGYWVAGGISALAWTIGLAGLAGPLWIDATNQGGLGAIMVIGLLGVLVGFFTVIGMVGAAIFGLFQKRAARLRPNLFALTDRRALLWKRDDFRNRGYEVNSLRRGSIIHIRRLEDDQGRGDVTFTMHLDPHVSTLGGWGPTVFENVPEVRHVEALARDALLVNPTGDEYGAGARIIPLSAGQGESPTHRGALP